MKAHRSSTLVHIFTCAASNHKERASIAVAFTSLLLLFVFGGNEVFESLGGDDASGLTSIKMPCSPRTKAGMSPNCTHLVSVDPQRTRRWINRKREQYQNSADFDGLQRIFTAVHAVGKDTSESIVLVGGTNDGQGSLNILQNSPSVALHGFEIQIAYYHAAVESFREYQFVHMHNLGWDEANSSDKPIGASKGTAGFYDPKGQRGFAMTNATVGTVALAEWTAQNSIDTVLYVLIDTEGYEARVIRGMHLEEVENRKRFPLFQYELGGTWAALDNRHGSETWTQQSTARYLEEKGYLLFLIGQQDWLLVNAQVFSTDGRTANVATSDEGYGPFIQGNVLAMHPEYVFPPLKKKIFECTKAKGKLATPRQ